MNRDTTMSGHFILYGRCGHVIAQCRCPGPNKSIRHSPELCHECKAKVNSDTSKEVK